MGGDKHTRSRRRHLGRKLHLGTERTGGEWTERTGGEKAGRTKQTGDRTDRTGSRTSLRNGGASLAKRQEASTINASITSHYSSYLWTPSRLTLFSVCFEIYPLSYLVIFRLYYGPHDARIARRTIRSTRSSPPPPRPLCSSPIILPQPRSSHLIGTYLSLDVTGFVTQHLIDGCFLTPLFAPSLACVPRA